MLGWQNQGLSTSTQITSGVSFSLGSTYYVNIRATDAFGNTQTTSSNGFIVIPEVTVQARSSAAPNWNDYYQKASPSSACTGTEGVTALRSDCVHGGERKMVTLTSTSCTGLTASDDLDAFTWHCSQSGGDAIFYSRNLKYGKGLANLITATDWKDNFVLIKNSSGTPIAASAPDAWWTNSILPLPNNDGTGKVDLTTASAVYVTNTSITSSGYYLKANKIAIVTLDSASVSLKSGTTGNCIDGDVLICTGFNSVASHFDWYEGRFVGKLQTVGTYATYNRFHKLHQKGSLKSTDATRNAITQSHLDIVYIDDGEHLLFEDVVANSVNISGDLSYGADILRVSSYYVQTNQGQMSPQHVNGISAYSFQSQISPAYAKGTYNLLAVSSLTPFMNITSPTVSQSFLPDGIMLAMATDPKFSGLLVLPTSSPTCTIMMGSNPGLDSSCNPAGLSNFTKVTRNGAILANSYNGFLSSDELENTSDTNGTASFASITDWFQFESFFRLWSEASGNSCATNCGIFDWRLKSSDTLLRNTTNDGVNQNDAFVAGSTCPAAVHGNKIATNQETSAKTYLLSAMEISNDEIGNDNTLCESNEECIYAPNFGGYQGYGDIYEAGTCTFQDGTVSGVKMYAFPNM